MSEYSESEQLKYQFKPEEETYKKKTGGKGQYYPEAEEISAEDLPIAVKNISATIYDKIDNSIDIVTAMGETMLSRDSMPVKKYIAGMYNVHNLDTMEITRLVKIGVTHPLYAVGGILAHSRRSWETFDISQYQLLNDGNMTVESPQLQPFMHRAYALYYGSLLTHDIDRIIQDIDGNKTENVLGSLTNMGNFRAIQWLNDKNFPLGLINSIIGNRIINIQNLLMSQIYKSVNLVTHYLTIGPHMMSNALMQAQQYMIMPLYRAINELPSFGSDVDKFLMDIIVEAQRVTSDAINKIQDQLKLSKFEQELMQRQAALISEMNKYMSMQNILMNLGELIDRDTLQAENEWAGGNDVPGAIG